MSADLTPFPANQARILRDILQRLDETLTTAKRNPPVPIERVTGGQGLFIPDGSAPTPVGGVALYAVPGSGFRVVHSDGTVHQILDPAAKVDNLGNLLSAQIGAAPTQAQYNNLQTDVATIRTKFNDLLVALRAKGHISLT